MKKIILFIMLFSCLILFGNQRFLERTERRIVLELNFSDLTFFEDENFSYFDLPEWEGSEISGSPDLPQKSFSILVPPEGDITVSIVTIDSYRQNITKPPVPVPDIIEFNETYKYEFEINKSLYENPTENFFLKKDQIHYRYYDYVPLIINPVNILSEREVEICSRLILQIDISESQVSRENFIDPFESFYSQIFANYEQGKYWRSKAEANIEKLPFKSSDFWYRLESEGSGLNVISEQELSILPEFYDPNSLRLFTMERQFLPEKEEDYQFQLTEIPLSIDQIAGDIYFNYENIGRDRPLNSPHKIFWLAFGGDFTTTPLRINYESVKEIPNQVISFSAYSRSEPLNRNRDINCLYISPQEFLTQTAELAQLHSTNYDLATAIADQQDIFDQYSGGEADPVAIKNYIHDFWLNLPTEEVLKYVILMGSGTHDWLDPTEKNRIMTYGDSDDNFVIFTANFAELIIGRIPAQNEEQLEFYLERLRTYVEEPLPGWWRNTMVIMADDENKDGGVEGFTSNSGLNHTNLAQITQNTLNDGLYVDKVLGLEYNFDEYNNKPDARNALIEKINEGCLIWYYIGHGNPDVLGDEDYFRGSQHLRLLDNTSYLPLFLAASCSVGEFDSPSFDSIAERLLFIENGGSIASLAASRECSGTANTSILRELLRKLVNERYRLGDAVYFAKTTTIYTSTGKKYNLLGDPVMNILPPLDTGTFSNVPDSIRARELVVVNADLDLQDQVSTEGTIRVFDSEYDVFYTNTLNDHTYEVTYSRNGSVYFKGGTDILNDSFSSSYIVPDDIRFGESGKIINYVYDEVSGSDYIIYETGIMHSSNAVDSISTDSPAVSLWLDSRSFLAGDYVSSSPVLIAEIEDSNGINILGSAGHKILVLLDDEYDPIDVTDQFNYYAGSHTRGELQYGLDNLEEGNHYLRLIVFDNFNNPTVAETEFKVRSSGSLSIEQMLVYPNPVKKDAHFTFLITEDSDIAISVYTITGRKIKTLKQDQCDAGYNQIYWNGKDEDGDRIANNTYFYKIKAKQLGNGEVTEKIGKLIILK
jgi:peptidase C25-like protein